MNLSSFILGFLVVLGTCLVPAHGERTCRIATHRVTGKNNLFSLICRCGDGLEMLGRSIRFLDPHTPDTIAQEELTVQCIEHRKPEMAGACLKSGSEFERLAAHVLRECMDRRPENPSAEERMPFTFRRDMCESEFRELDVDRVEALLVCACTQRPGYIVHPGVIQFITTGSPNGASEEQKLLLNCTREALPRLTDTCSNMPERFDLRSAQAFNVCCKRVRVLFALDKLKCQATVPDDVTELDLTFV
ncbi:hypothetical protein BWQ96_09409 [Gracilariopsis chorda]|uniref:Uncharacterized protein n=1 Tax=Gracilariopsis chorda TaxID=448386 RepID=A0A2V3IFL1_9FLOR|nr:hypothetical protein BWQ96_09409 [Gracilariopsis chorda]|eukprot:PXF40864.1 hypothetical protein BWQ96_09409 [Gracilariopsis chorda]